MRKLLLLACLQAILSGAFGQAADSVITVTDNGFSKDTVGVFSRVEVEASFPGGLEGWRKFLMSTIDTDRATKDVPKKAKGFQQTAVVQFIVCKDGSLCEIKVINDVLPSIRKEAENAIRQSGLWLPAEQNGRKVKAYRKQPITFVVN